MEQNPAIRLSKDEIDIIGEVWNISMGSSATALSNILSHKVIITSPQVEIATREKIRDIETVPSVGVSISFISGISGSDLLIIHKDDVLKIVERMMGGSVDGGEFSEMEMSAISEVMNQMMGSAATALSNMLKREVNISPPRSFLITEENREETMDSLNLDSGEQVLVKFSFQVEDLLNSEIYTILTYGAVMEIVSMMMQDFRMEAQPAPAASSPVPSPAPAAAVSPSPAPAAVASPSPAPAVPQPAPARPVAPAPQPVPAQAEAASAYAGLYPVPEPPKTQVHPARLPSFDSPLSALVPSEMSNFNLIEDVPLDIAVEVGRAKRSVKDIIALSSGSIIELDKQAGDPVDIIVSGQLIAKGEVVVIDESFGVRITEIIEKKSV